MFDIFVLISADVGRVLLPNSKEVGSGHSFLGNYFSCSVRCNLLL